MKHPARVEDYLEHIAEAIERATGYLQPVPDLAAFKKNPQAQDAVVRNIEIIGEAVNKINSTAKESTFVRQNTIGKQRGLRSNGHGRDRITSVVIYTHGNDKYPLCQRASRC